MVLSVYGEKDSTVWDRLQHSLEVTDISRKGNKDMQHYISIYILYSIGSRVDGLLEISSQGNRDNERTAAIGVCTTSVVVCVGR